MPAPGVGGVQTSLVSMVQSLTQRLRGRNNITGPKRDPAPGKGAPILSPGGGASTYAPGFGPAPDVDQFDDTFDPGGLFSPGRPIPPVDYERLRMWNFPLGYNYLWTPRSYEPISFPELRALGRQTLPRLCIETRKDQLEALGWLVRPKKVKDTTPSKDALSRSKTVSQFISKPDGRSSFAEFLRMQIEDMLVTDAPASELRRSKGGTPLAVEYVDGATFKVLVDSTGRRPLPPAPAYEQIIHGRPWVLTEDGRIATEGSGVPLFDQQIIYMPRNQVGYRPYGFSPVEQIIITINTALRRELMQLAHFTEGNVPQGGLAGADTWTAEQIRQAQEWFDSMLSGNIDNKTKIWFLPPGTKYQPFKEAPYKDDFDEWLARIVSFAFSLPPTWAVKQVNRATAQTAQEVALEEGLEPLMIWAKRYFDHIIQVKLGHEDLEFAWEDKRPVDPKDQADILKELTASGINTLNEARDILGLDSIDGGDDAFIIVAGTGPVLVKHLEDVSTIAATPPPPPAPPMGAGGRPGGVDGKIAPKPASKSPPARTGNKPAKPTSKKVGGVILDDDAVDPYYAEAAALLERARLRHHPAA